MWYLEREGGKAAGTLVSVDSSIQPPSYAVRIDKTNSVRCAHASAAALVFEALQDQTAPPA